MARPNEIRRLLLLSTSTIYGSGYLDYAEAEIRDFLGNVSRHPRTRRQRDAIYRLERRLERRRADNPDHK